MDPIYRELSKLLEKKQPLAFAVLVETKGSTPQKCGAKAIFLPDGRILGTLGGGCLEAETRQKALRALETGESFNFKAVLDDDFGWDDGLICGGSVQTFVQPNPRSREVWERLLADADSRERKVLATIVTSPDKNEIGARALFSAERFLTGDSLSDERRNQLAGNCATILKEAEPEPQLHILSGPSFREDEPQTARAEPRPPTEELASVYFEPILPNPTLVLCGGGHIGCAIGKLAAWCGFNVIAVDDRATFANKERFPDASKIIVDDPAKVVKDLHYDEDTYICIATRGHLHDAVILREVIHSKAAYIGMIGSKRKVRTIMEGFIKDGVATAEDFRRVHSPMGLAIRSISVEEIAISVLAELIAVRRGKHDIVSLSVTNQLADKMLRSEGST